MWFYILLMISEILLCRKSRINRTDLITGEILISQRDSDHRYEVGIAILILVSSIRYKIGYDFNNYLYTCNSYRFRTIDDVIKNGRFEALDNFILYIGAYFDKPILSFTIYSCIIFGGLGVAIKKYSDDRVMSIVIYMALFLVEALSSIRQTSADVILLLAYSFIKERKPIHFLIMLTIASGFHTMAIAGIGIYIAYQLPFIMFGLGILTVVTIGRFFAMWFLERYLPYYSGYVSDKALNDSGSGNFVKYLYLAILVYALLIYAFQYNHTKKETLKEVEGLIKIYIIGAVCPFLFGGLAGSRVGRFYLIYIVLLFPLLNKTFPKYQRRIFLLPFIAIYILYLAVTLRNGNSYIPYATWFNIGKM